MPSPSKSSAQAAAQTTDVLGYYNPNKFPISISSDQMGINYTVPAKGADKNNPGSYVLDREGRKINDPKLDHYTRAGGLLVKEFSKKPVPLVLLAGQPKPMSGAASVTGTTGTPVRGTIGTGMLKTKLPEPTTQPPSAAPAASAGSIRAMTVAEAQKAHLIPPVDRRDRFAQLPTEDNSGEAAKSAPFIDQVAPVRAPIVPKTIKLQTVDTSHLSDLESQDAVAATTASVAQDAQIELPAPTGLTVTAHPVAEAAPRAEFAGVTYDGKVYKTPGNLMKALKKKFNGDESLATEAFEQFKGQFPAPSNKKA